MQTSKTKLTFLGKIVDMVEPGEDNCNHLNYMQIELDAQSPKATLFEPTSLKVRSRYIKDYHQLKSERYPGIKLFGNDLSIIYVYRGDQCYNMHDCGRFSLVYLLSALNGKDITKLSRFEVYQGFKNWIEGKSGLLSYQKTVDKKAEQEATKKRKAVIEDVLLRSQSTFDKLEKTTDDKSSNIWVEAENRTKEIDELSIKIEQLSKEITEEMDRGLYSSSIEEKRNYQSILYTRKSELTTLLTIEYGNIGKKLDDFHEEFKLNLEKHKKDTDTERNAALKPLIRQEVEQEINAPILQKTWFATFTTPWRKVVDFILSYYPIQPSVHTIVFF